MKKSSNTVGIVVMAIGILLLLAFLGINIGWIIALLIPSYFIYKGWQLFASSESTAKKIFGVVLLVVGLLWLTGMLHVIIGLAIAALLIYYGLKMIKQHKSVAVEPHFEVAVGETTKSAEHLYKNYDYLDEWEKEIKKINRNLGGR